MEGLPGIHQPKGRGFFFLITTQFRPNSTRPRHSLPPGEKSDFLFTSGHVLVPITFHQSKSEVRGQIMVMAPLAAEHALWGTQASVVAARGLRSCGAQAQLLHCTWEIPRSRIEPMCHALASRFFTTEPPGKL